MGRYEFFVEEIVTEATRATMVDGLPSRRILMDFMEYSINYTKPALKNTDSINANVFYKLVWTLDTHFMYYKGCKVLDEATRVQLENMINRYVRGPEPKLYRGLLESRVWAGFQLRMDNSTTARFFRSTAKNYGSFSLLLQADSLLTHDFSCLYALSVVLLLKQRFLNGR